MPETVRPPVPGLEPGQKIPGIAPDAQAFLDTVVKRHGKVNSERVDAYTRDILTDALTSGEITEEQLSDERVMGKAQELATQLVRDNPPSANTFEWFFQGDAQAQEYSKQHLTQMLMNGEISEADLSSPSVMAKAEEAGWRRFSQETTHKAIEALRWEDPLTRSASPDYLMMGLMRGAGSADVDTESFVGTQFAKRQGDYLRAAGRTLQSSLGWVPGIEGPGSPESEKIRNKAIAEGMDSVMRAMAEEDPWVAGLIQGAGSLAGLGAGLGAPRAAIGGLKALWGLRKAAGVAKAAGAASPLWGLAGPSLNFGQYSAQLADAPEESRPTAFLKGVALDQILRWTGVAGAAGWKKAAEKLGKPMEAGAELPLLARMLISGGQGAGFGLAEGGEAGRLTAAGQNAILFPMMALMHARYPGKDVGEKPPNALLQDLIASAQRESAAKFLERQSGLSRTEVLEREMAEEARAPLVDEQVGAKALFQNPALAKTAFYEAAEAMGISAEGKTAREILEIGRASLNNEPSEATLGRFRRLHDSATALAKGMPAWAREQGLELGKGGEQVAGMPAVERRRQAMALRRREGLTPGFQWPTSSEMERASQRLVANRPAVDRTQARINREIAAAKKTGSAELEAVVRGSASSYLVAANKHEQTESDARVRLPTLAKFRKLFPSLRMVKREWLGSFVYNPTIADALLHGHPGMGIYPTLFKSIAKPEQMAKFLSHVRKSGEAEFSRVIGILKGYGIGGEGLSRQEWLLWGKDKDGIEVGPIRHDDPDVGEQALRGMGAVTVEREHIGLKALQTHGQALEKARVGMQEKYQLLQRAPSAEVRKGLLEGIRRDKQTFDAIRAEMRKTMAALDWTNPEARVHGGRAEERIKTATSDPKLSVQEKAEIAVREASETALALKEQELQNWCKQTGIDIEGRSFLGIAGEIQERLNRARSAQELASFGAMKDMASDLAAAYVAGEPKGEFKLDRADDWAAAGGLKPKRGPGATIPEKTGPLVKVKTTLAQATVDRIRSQLRKGMTLFRGSRPGGSADLGDVGRGRYFSSSRERAEAYGEVSEHEVKLENPLVLSEKEGYREIADRFGTVSTKEKGMLPTEERRRGAKNAAQAIRDAGHDGVVLVRTDPEGEFLEVMRLPREPSEKDAQEIADRLVTALYGDTPEEQRTLEDLLRHRKEGLAGRAWGDVLTAFRAAFKDPARNDIQTEQRVEALLKKPLKDVTQKELEQFLIDSAEVMKERLDKQETDPLSDAERRTLDRLEGLVDELEHHREMTDQPSITEGRIVTEEEGAIVKPNIAGAARTLKEGITLADQREIKEAREAGMTGKMPTGANALSRITQLGKQLSQELGREVDLTKIEQWPTGELDEVAHRLLRNIQKLSDTVDSMSREDMLTRNPNSPARKARSRLRVMNTVLSKIDYELKKQLSRGVLFYSGVPIEPAIEWLNQHASRWLNRWPYWQHIRTWPEKIRAGAIRDAWYVHLGMGLLGMTQPGQWSLRHAAPSFAGLWGETVSSKNQASALANEDLQKLYKIFGESEKDQKGWTGLFFKSLLDERARAKDLEGVDHNLPRMSYEERFALHANATMMSQAYHFWKDTVLKRIGEWNVEIEGFLGEKIAQARFVDPEKYVAIHGMTKLKAEKLGLSVVPGTSEPEGGAARRRPKSGRERHAAAEYEATGKAEVYSVDPLDIMTNMYFDRLMTINHNSLLREMGKFNHNGKVNPATGKPYQELEKVAFGKGHVELAKVSAGTAFADWAKEYSAKQQAKGKPPLPSQYTSRETLEFVAKSKPAKGDVAGKKAKKEAQRILAKAERAESQTYLVPKPIADAWDAYLFPHGRNTVPIIGKISDFYTRMMLYTGAEAVWHGANVIGAVMASPHIGQNKKMKLLAWLGGPFGSFRFLATLHELWHVGPEAERIFEILAKHGALRASYFAEEGEGHPATQIAMRMTGLAGLKRMVFGMPEFQPSSMLKGITHFGAETRARIALYKLIKKYDAKEGVQRSDAEICWAINNTLGTYVKELAPFAANALRNTLYDPFGAAGTALTKTGIKAAHFIPPQMTFAGKSPKDLGEEWLRHGPELVVATAMATIMTNVLHMAMDDEGGPTWSGAFKKHRSIFETPGAKLTEWMTGGGKKGQTHIWSPGRLFANAPTRGFNYTGFLPAFQAYLREGELNQRVFDEFPRAWKNLFLGRMGPLGRSVFGAVTGGKSPYITSSGDFLDNRHFGQSMPEWHLLHAFPQLEGPAEVATSAGGWRLTNPVHMALSFFGMEPRVRGSNYQEAQLRSIVTGPRGERYDALRKLANHLDTLGYRQGSKEYNTFLDAALMDEYGEEWRSVKREFLNMQKGRSKNYRRGVIEGTREYRRRTEEE